MRVKPKSQMNNCKKCRLYLGCKDDPTVIQCAKRGTYIIDLATSYSCYMDMPAPGTKFPKIAGMPDKEKRLYIPDRPILLAYQGSHAHGTYIPPSDPDSIDDIDLIGICVGPDTKYFGMDYNHFEQLVVFYKQFDSIVYEIKKVFKLLLQCNPNLISVLFLRPSEYIYLTDNGVKILNHRDIFISKKAYSAIRGYVQGQLEHMLKSEFKGYMGAKRKALVEKYGYDVKDAAHIVRLLRNGIELLKTGYMQVYRTYDRDELIAIKTGKKSLASVIEQIDLLGMELDAAFKTCKLPEEPEYKSADLLLTSILKEELC